jgi:hypothetical protein
MVTTDFNNLPQQIDKILNEVSAIKVILERIKKPEEIPKKNLNLDDALDFLKNQGFPMSKSKIYKLCASKKIPHSHFGNRLVFNTKELIGWAENKLKK